MREACRTTGALIRELAAGLSPWPRLRPRPLAYGGSGRAGAEPVASPLDVIVPVYGAAAEFGRCLASLESATDLARHRLVVVLDGPGQAEAPDALAAAGRRLGDGLLVLENPERRGYVASVNRGMAASRRDVVLLNSDTIVTQGWLDKLQAAAYSASDVATVTPFSNNATICSIPRFLAVNAIPSGHDIE
ncbi:MAG: glycosyltransferase family 2 protein [Candidatus Rokuibacteriota bacterium]